MSPVFGGPRDLGGVWGGVPPSSHPYLGVFRTRGVAGEVPNFPPIFRGLHKLGVVGGGGRLSPVFRGLGDLEGDWGGSSGCHQHLGGLRDRGGIREGPQFSPIFGGPQELRGQPRGPGECVGGLQSTAGIWGGSPGYPHLGGPWPGVGRGPRGRGGCLSIARPGQRWPHSIRGGVCVGHPTSQWCRCPGCGGRCRCRQGARRQQEQPPRGVGGPGGFGGRPLPSSCGTAAVTGGGCALAPPPDPLGTVPAERGCDHPLGTAGTPPCGK